MKAKLIRAHKEVIEGLISGYFRRGEKGLLETLVGFLENIRKYYIEKEASR